MTKEETIKWVKKEIDKKRKTRDCVIDQSTWKQLDEDICALMSILTLLLEDLS